jgi:hypothetical protein
MGEQRSADLPSAIRGKENCWKRGAVMHRQKQSVGQKKKKAVMHRQEQSVGQKKKKAVMHRQEQSVGQKKKKAEK